MDYIVETLSNPIIVPFALMFLIPFVILAAKFYLFILRSDLFPLFETDFDYESASLFDFDFGGDFD